MAVRRGGGGGGTGDENGFLSFALGLRDARSSFFPFPHLCPPLPCPPDPAPQSHTLSIWASVRELTCSPLRLLSLSLQSDYTRRLLSKRPPPLSPSRTLAVLHPPPAFLCACATFIRHRTDTARRERARAALRPPPSSVRSSLARARSDH